MNTSDFTNIFWEYYVAIIVIASFLGLVWLLLSQNKAGSKNGTVETMGHEWDGIEEFNNPLPRWWFYLFVITVIFGIVYLVLYPGFASYKGVLGWTSQNQYDKEVVQAAAKYQPLYDKFKGMTIEEISQDPQAKQMGQNMFKTYCIQCHASDAKGTIGFPNLTDNDWLWGGSPDEIKDTIQTGQMGMMAAWGPTLGEEGVKDVMHYVFSLNENANVNARADQTRAARGKDQYQAICASCHQDDGKGLIGMAPNLTDDVWLWGNRDKDIINTITNGHTNEMPGWERFLVTKDAEGNIIDESKLNILTAYVWGLSNSGGKAVETPSEQTDEAVSADEQASIEEVDGMYKVYFPVGRADINAEIVATLEKIAALAADDSKTIQLSGFHDETGDFAFNQELAKKRAHTIAVQLEDLGIAESQIEMVKPATTEGEGSNAEARRVEITLK